MNYRELKAVALPVLAEIATDVQADVVLRLSAYETLIARIADVNGGLWSAFTSSERATLRNAFMLDVDTMARRGFNTAAAIKRVEITAALRA